MEGGELFKTAQIDSAQQAEKAKKLRPKKAKADVNSKQPINKGGGSSQKVRKTYVPVQRF